MKNKAPILIALIFWMIFTIILVCSVVGLLLFVRADYNTKYYQGEEGRGGWVKIGLKLMDKLTE